MWIHRAYTMSCYPTDMIWLLAMWQAVYDSQCVTRQGHCNTMFCYTAKVL